MIFNTENGYCWTLLSLINVTGINVSHTSFLLLNDLIYLIDQIYILLGYQKQINVLYEGSGDATKTRGQPKRAPQFFDHITEDQREIVENQVMTKNNQKSVGSNTTPAINLCTSSEIQELLNKNIRSVLDNLNEKINSLKSENPLDEIMGRLQRIEDKVDRLTVTTKATEKKRDLKSVSSPNLPTPDASCVLSCLSEAVLLGVETVRILVILIYWIPCQPGQSCHFNQRQPGW